MTTSAIDNLVALLSRMPGVGQRSARRMALHLIRQREGLMLPLADALRNTAESIHTCSQCGNLDTSDPCHICTDHRRDPHTLCVVEDLADLWAMERGHVYRGYYHVLGGTLSAIDGRSPASLNIDRLVQRAANDSIQEVIIATNATVEGQTTAHYITERLHTTNVRVSRLAHGIPMGGELDYLDEGTLGAALNARLPF